MLVLYLARYWYWYDMKPVVHQLLTRNTVQATTAARKYLQWKLFLDAVMMY